MRLPTHAPVSCASPARRCLLALIAPLTLIVSPALATHYVVDLNGGGDFTTIQAALDQQLAVFRDTILVLPGQYAETMMLPQPTSGTRYIVSTGGAAQTGVLSITAPDDTQHSSIGRYFLEGFSFVQDVTLANQYWSRAQFARCAFLQDLSYSPYGGDSPPNFFDCDFYGRTKLEWCLSVWEAMRFHGAPLTITHASGTGSFWLRNCSFEGPADTLVYMPWASQDFGAFEQCAFTNALNGLVYGEDCRSVTMPLGSCTFRDLTGAGISYEPKRTSWSSGLRPATLDLRDSRFERCGSAVRWVVNSAPDVGGGAVHLTRDTVLASTADGIVLGPSGEQGAPITGCIVEGSGSDGLLIFGQPDLTQLGFVNYTISNSSFLDNRGSGIVVRDTFPRPGSDPTWPHRGTFVQNCTFAHNGGAAARMSAHRWRIEGCVALDNGEGFVWDIPTKWARLVSNTSVLNRGSGFEGVPVSAPDSALLVRGNLAAMNAGDGFRVQTGPAGSFAFNDAWGNYLAQYVGAWASLDSNLTVDPRFCDLSAGVSGLGLQQGSPCGPSGVYGLIGARPEECPNTTAVEPPAPGAMAFAVRPSIARGAAEFVPPTTGADGVVELFDLAGRVVWRAPLGPATGVVRWRGEGGLGHVRAGLYWARFTRGGERATQRLVWLE